MKLKKQRAGFALDGRQGSVVCVPDSIKCGESGRVLWLGDNRADAAVDCEWVWCNLLVCYQRMGGGTRARVARCSFPLGGGAVVDGGGSSVVVFRTFVI